MQTWMSGNDIYSSDHGVFVVDGVLDDHVPAGELVANLSDNGTVGHVVRCTLGECEYRSDSLDTRKGSVRKLRKHLARKH